MPFINEEEKTEYEVRQILGGMAQSPRQRDDKKDGEKFILKAILAEKGNKSDERGSPFRIEVFRAPNGGFEFVNYDSRVKRRRTRDEL